MKISAPILRPQTPFPHYTYFFFGTVDREFNRDEWMFAKVGIAVNVHRRLISYKTHCPVPFHTGLKIECPNTEEAKKLENAILEDENLKDYRPKGKSEWFIVFAGPHQHMIFIKDLLACIYVHRYRNQLLWDSRLEWVIWTDQERLSEIPDADEKFFCGKETGEKNIYDDGMDGSELARRVKAEDQAKVLARLIYPNFED
jgi:hypothetical protein